MASYLLLRSNKRSGPYSLEDLVSFGLKPYDLVWIEGKSAAWRYPSEVEELKPYAPGVEEQPYDRFFKKPSQEKKEEVIEKQQPVIEKQQPVIEKVLVEETPVVQMQEKYIPKKSVFVTMPGKLVAVGSTQPAVQSQQSGVGSSQSADLSQQLAIGNSQSAVSSPLVAGALAKETTVSNHQADNLSKYQPKPEVQYNPQPEPQPQSPVISVTENPAAQIKYSQPLDEIKEMYVKTLQERKSKIARKSFLLANLKRASVIAALVALGVLAGFILKSNGGNKSILSSQPVQHLPGSAVADQIQKPLPANDIKEEKNSSILNESPTALDQQKQTLTQEKNTEVPEETESRKKLEARILELERQQVQQQVSPQRVKKEMIPANREINEVSDQQATRPVQNDPATGERSRTVRNDNSSSQEKALMPKPKKSALSNLVSISSNDYKRVAFGGIRNLELTVVNDSKFILDKVTVELQYLKPSEEPLKTEMVQFHSVSPNGSLTMKIKDTNRGIKVSYRIVDIQTSQESTALSGF
jgi:hypothetical protein